jgi:hypothetical protein
VIAARGAECLTEGRRRRERGCAKNSEHPASVTTCCNNTSPLTLCRALGMRAAVAARKPGLAGTAAFRRGAAQRGKVGRAAVVRGRRSRGTGALAGRGGSVGGFLGAMAGSRGSWGAGHSAPCAQGNSRGTKKWSREGAEAEGKTAGGGAMGRSGARAPAMEESRASAAMGGAPTGNPTHAVMTATKGKGRLHQGTWPWGRAGRRRAPKELGHGCWWLPAAAGHGEKRVALAEEVS